MWQDSKLMGQKYMHFFSKLSNQTLKVFSKPCNTTPDQWGQGGRSHTNKCGKAAAILSHSMARMTQGWDTQLKKEVRRVPSQRQELNKFEINDYSISKSQAGHSTF